MTDAFKRVLLGRPFRTDKLADTLLPKRKALPLYASDALSSVAYAPNEIMLTLSLAGVSAVTLSPWVGLAVLVVLGTVVASYRQNVHAYPSGGGDYEIAATNLGRHAGVTVAAALLVDYVLTVAVSISSATQYLITAVPALAGREVLIAVALVVIMALANLRGLRESGTAFAIPTYIFIAAVLGTCVWGFVRALTGTLPAAASSAYQVVPSAGYEHGLVGLAGGFLLLRAFSSGAAALTGVEAISNGVPTFRPPKSKNAATTLLLLGAIAAAMLSGVLVLARITGVNYVEFPATQLRAPSGALAGPDYMQDPVISQLAATVFSAHSPFFYLVAIATGLILVLAANTAFNGFPVLASILARDGFLPRQLATRGDRLTFSNGILLLATLALVLVIAFDADVSRLIQLYIVGVFVSFTASQLGMVRHWTGLIRSASGAEARHMRRSRVINAAGFGMTALVLVIVLVTKFSHGAWITLLAMAVIYLVMVGIRRHYDSVARELALDGPEAAEQASQLPSRVYAIVLVSKVHQPTLRALAYARAARPSTLEALTVDTDHEETARLRKQWQELKVPVSLTAIDSPYREITRPVIDYVKRLRKASPRDVVVVYIPEYVVGHWWEHLLHNQSAIRIISRLHFMPGVVVTSVPWQLQSSHQHAVEALQTTALPVVGGESRGGRGGRGGRNAAR